MSYQSVVSGQSPQHYYRLQDALTDEQGGAALVRGASTAEPQYATGTVDTSPRCLSYDGGDASYHTVSLTNKLSISACMKFTSFSGTQVWFELGNPNFNSIVTKGAIAYSDGSVLNVAMFDGTNYDTQTYTLPSTGVWNHWAFVFDRSASGASRMVVYKDGSALTPSTSGYQTTTTNFTPTVVTHMSRQGGSLFQAGSMDDLATWDTAISAANVSAQYAALTNTVTKTFTADAIVATRNTKTVTADGIVKATQASTFTADAVVTSAITKTFTADAVVQGTNTQTFTADAVVSAAGLQVAEGGLVFLFQPVTVGTQTKTFTADAVVVTGSAVTRTSTFTVDGIVKATQTRTVTADAVVVTAAAPAGSTTTRDTSAPFLDNGLTLAPFTPVGTTAPFDRTTDLPT